MGDIAISVAPLEYVLIRKLQYHAMSGSDRHLRDIAMMLKISGDLLDHKAMENWLNRLGLSAAWEHARSFEPS